MSRFYKSPDPQFIDNFIFEPNFKMLESGLAKKDAEILGKLANVELYRDVGIKATPWDAPLAQQERDAIAAQTESIAKDIYANKLTSASDSKLNELARSVERNYLKGPIADYQKSGLEYEKYKAKLATLSPAAQEIYKRIPERHVAAMQQTEGYKPFKAGEMYESVNDIDAFFKSPSFATLQPTDQEALKAWKKGGGDLRGYFTHLDNPGVAEERIMSTFRSFLESDPNTMGRFKSYQDIAPDKFKYFDDQGKLSFDEGYTLGNMLPSIKAHEFERPNQKIVADQIALAALHKGRTSTKPNTPFSEQSFSRSAEKAMAVNTINNLMDQRLEGISKNIKSQLLAKGIPIDALSFDTLNYPQVQTKLSKLIRAKRVATQISSDPKGKQALAALEYFQEDLAKAHEQLANAVSQTWGPLEKILGDPAVTEIKKKVAEDFSSPEGGASPLFMSRRMMINLGGDYLFNTRQVNADTGIIFDTGDQIIGSSITDTKGRQPKKVEEIKVSTQAATPLIRTLDPGEWENNYLSVPISIVFTDGTKMSANSIVSFEDYAALAVSHDPRTKDKEGAVKGIKRLGKDRFKESYKPSDTIKSDSPGGTIAFNQDLEVHADSLYHDERARLANLAADESGQIISSKKKIEGIAKDYLKGMTDSEAAEKAAAEKKKPFWPW